MSRCLFHDYNSLVHSAKNSTPHSRYPSVRNYVVAIVEVVMQMRNDNVVAHEINNTSYGHISG